MKMNYLGLLMLSESPLSIEFYCDSLALRQFLLDFSSSLLYQATISR